MTCASCVATLESFLGSLDGVQQVSVVLLAERADVVADERISDDQLVQAVNDIGFEGTRVRSEPMVVRFCSWSFVRCFFFFFFFFFRFLCSSEHSSSGSATTAAVRPRLV